MDQVTGKIIRILNFSQVIMNIGKSQKIIEGQVGRILGSDEDIVDPDTNEILGRVQISKGRVKIDTISEKWCLGSIIDAQYKGNKKTNLSSISGSAVRVNDITPWKATSEQIGIGDIVVFDAIEMGNTDDIPF